jgi:hypothetical protein
MIYTGTNFVKIDFDTLIKGATFTGRQFEILSNDLPIDLTDATINVDFRYQSAAGKIVKKLTNDLGITIISSEIFQIDNFDVDFSEGLYHYLITITLSSGEIKKYVYGFLKVIL